jgi:hypothetical protein
LDELNKGKTNLSSQSGGNINEKACQAPINMSYQVARAGKTNIIADILIKQRIMDVVETLIGEKFSNFIKNVPLSKDTVSRRIHEINAETDNEVTERIKSSQCSALQLDETTNAAGIAVFLLSPGT